MKKYSSEDKDKDGQMLSLPSLANTVHPAVPSLAADTDPQIRRILLPIVPTVSPRLSPPLVVHIMSHPHPNFNPHQEQFQNQHNYVKSPEYEQYAFAPQYLHPMPAYGWYIQPAPVGYQQTHIQNPPKIVIAENIAQSNNKAMETQIISGDSVSSPDPDGAFDEPLRTKTSKKERSNHTVIPTTKFINETFDFNRKKRTRKKSKAEKLPDPQLTETVKEVLKEYELNQKSLSLDVGCSETMVSQWINGTSKATGWSDFEAKIRIWLNQEHKKPDKGPMFNFIDESSKLKTKFLRKSKK